jgi:hypothetical protein
MRNNALLFAVIIISVLLFARNSKAFTEDEEAAIKSANLWLEIVDSRRYAESWRKAALLLQNAVSEDQFVKSLAAARGAFGKVLSRRVISATYAESLPGAPDGRYVVIQYKTSFEKKKSSIETVTPKQESGEWRVSGYYIK